jgi:carbon monoxide dehydrogenase subunit G
MAIEIREKFAVAAPIETVWAFVMDPHKIAPCLPGAKLEEVVDERNFLGSVKIKIGAITTSYKGKVELTEVDQDNRVVVMLAEGRETSGGMAKGLVTSRLRSLDDGQTEVVAEASVDLTGRVMQVGSRMIEGVSHQLFQQFAKKLKKQLEAEPGAVAVAGGGPVEAGAAPPAEQEAEALAILPLILRSLWQAIVGFFRRLFKK